MFKKYSTIDSTNLPVTVHKGIAPKCKVSDTIDDKKDDKQMVLQSGVMTNEGCRNEEKEMIKDLWYRF